MSLDQQKLTQEIIDHQYQVEIRQTLLQQHHQIQALQTEIQQLKQKILGSKILRIPRASSAAA